MLCRGEPESPAVGSCGSSGCHSGHCCDALPPSTCHHWWTARGSERNARKANFDRSLIGSDAGILIMQSSEGCFGDESSAAFRIRHFLSCPSNKARGSSNSEGQPRSAYLFAEDLWSC